MRNGFLGLRNGEHVLEWRFDGCVDPNDGAKLYVVKNGKETLVVIYDFDNKKFIKLGD